MRTRNLLVLLCALCIARPAFAQNAEATESTTTDETVEVAEAPANPPTLEEQETEPEGVTPAPGVPVDPNEILRMYEPSLVRVHYSLQTPGQEQVASAMQVGVVVSEDGVVMVPGHLQALNAKPSGIAINIGDKNYEGELLRREGQLNVSYVRVQVPEDEADPPIFHPLSFDTPVELSLGEPVWVLGILPQQAGYERLMRQQRIAAVLDDPSRVYVLDQVPLPGEVGGLIVTMDGRVAGVMGYELSPQQGGELYVRSGLPLVFPNTALAKSIALPRDPTKSQDTEAWFGILVQPLKPDFAEYFGIPDQTGCIVSNVVPDSPAEKAGLVRGDILTAFDDTPIDVPNDLALLTFTRNVRDIPIGTTVHVTYLRDGKEQTTDVVLEAIPTTAAKAQVFTQPAYGLRVREITRDVIYLANLAQDTTGVIVDHVDAGSPAQAAGLRPGDVIHQMNGEDITDLAGYIEHTDQIAVSRPDKIVLFLQRGNRTGFTTIEPDWTLPARED